MSTTNGKSAEVDVITPAQKKQYQKLMALADAAFDEATHNIALGWQSLWLIYDQDLWRAEHATIVEWLEELRVRRSISRGDFYAVMDMVKNLKALKQSEEMILAHLGKQLTAVKVDLPKMLGEDRKLLPQAEKQIKEQWGSPGKMLNALLDSDPGTARKVVREISNDDEIFALSDGAFFNPQSNELLFNVRHDNARRGLVGIYTVRVTVTEITEGRTIKEPKKLTEKLAKWLAGRCGVRL